MVVQSSNIGMRSERYYRKREEEVKSLQLWGTSKNGQDELQMGNALKEGGVDAKEIAEAKNTVKSSRNIQKQEGSELKKSIHQIQAEAIQYLLDLFFGDGKGKHTALDMLGQTNAQAFGGSYQEISYYSEEETTSFQTEGTVKTADGREMSFQIKVEMSRSFTSYMEKRVDFGAARLCDPLVINLNSSTAQVTDQKFYFDLDADGTAAVSYTHLDVYKRQELVIQRKTWRQRQKAKIMSGQICMKALLKQLRKKDSLSLQQNSGQ